jgi:cytosine/creatinine deaminase
MITADISIRNARQRHTGDVLVDIAIAEGRIAASGTSLRVEAREEIDACGGLVTPSYVNPHLHLCKVWTLRSTSAKARMCRLPSRAASATARRALGMIEAAS